MAKFRRLKRNCVASIPRRLIFVDCESYREPSATCDSIENQRLRLACATSIRWRKDKPAERLDRVFMQPAPFWRWVNCLSVTRGTTWIFAHKLSFDATMLDLWGEIASGRLKIAHWYQSPERSITTSKRQPDKMPMVVLGDPPTIIGLVNSRGHKIACVDTLNYWRCKLAELGDEIGFSKQIMPDQWESDETWIAYCRRDVEILVKAVCRLIKWWQDGDYGEWSFTAPSLAMHAYRHRFMKTPIHAHDEVDVRKLERSAYYGGRLEAYWLGHLYEPAYLIDVNSLYPAMMYSNYFPCQLWDWGYVNEFTTLQPPYEPPDMVAEVIVNTREPWYPLRTEKGVIYPVGQFVTCLCGPELAEAVSRHNVVAWGNWSYYRMMPIFREYVKHFWAMKQRAEQDCNKPELMLAKLMLNSLQGKLGQKGARWTYAKGMPPSFQFREWAMKDVTTGERGRYLSLWDKTFKHVEPKELPNSIPAIPAWCASAARAYMARAIELAGWQHCYYISTDALIVDRHGLTNLENAGYLHVDQLGMFRIKATGLSAHIGGLHQYRVGDHIVFGGVPKGITPDRYGRWEATEFPGLCEIIASGGKPDIQTIKIYKHLHMAYDRRRTDLGQRTVPYHTMYLPRGFNPIAYRSIIRNGC